MHPRLVLVMNPKGARSLLSSKVKLGADASAAVVGKCIPCDGHGRNTRSQ